MAARDEGLDKLEAFIAAAAEARASLQKGTDDLDRLREALSGLQEEGERRLQAFADELEELGDRSAPAVERLLPVIGPVLVGGVLFGPLGAVAAALLVVAAARYGPELVERLEDLEQEWPALAEELGGGLVSAIEEETREVDEAFRELMDAVEEEAGAASEDEDEVLEAFQDPEQVLERGAEALS